MKYGLLSIFIALAV